MLLFFSFHSRHVFPTIRGAHQLPLSHIQALEPSPLQQTFQALVSPHEGRRQHILTPASRLSYSHEPRPAAASAGRASKGWGCELSSSETRTRAAWAPHRGRRRNASCFPPPPSARKRASRSGAKIRCGENRKRGAREFDYCSSVHLAGYRASCGACRCAGALKGVRTECE